MEAELRALLGDVVFGAMCQLQAVAFALLEAQGLTWARRNLYRRAGGSHHDLPGLRVFKGGVELYQRGSSTACWGVPRSCWTISARCRPSAKQWTGGPGCWAPTWPSPPRRAGPDPDDGAIRWTGLRALAGPDFCHVRELHLGGVRGASA